MRLLRGRPPALWLGLAALLGILIALATAAPPAVTLRSSLDATAAVRVPVARDLCTTLAVLPDETRAVRASVWPGLHPPERATMQRPGGATIALGAPVLVDGGTRVMYRLPSEASGSAANVGVCFDAASPRAGLGGAGSTPRIDLLGAERGSWLEAVPVLASRAGYARSVVGWAALPLALLCLVGAWVLALRVTPRGAGAVVDGRAVRSVALVATLLASAYAITTPPMQTPDEMVHLNYVDLLRDRHEVPRSIEAGPYSSQLEALISQANVSAVAFRPDRRPPWTQVQEDELDAALAAVPGHDVRDVFTNASSQPPGYYALGAVATTVTGGDVVDRMLVVRLLSALLIGLAAAGTVVFARAAVPSAGGLVIVGGLLFAALPIVSFIGGSVNPDSALAATSAWALAALATMWRQGVTMRRAVWLGLATALGLLSKLTFAPLLAVIGVGALLIAVREVRSGRGRQLVRPLATGAALLVVVGLPFMAWAKLSGRGIVFNPPVAGPPGAPVHLREVLAYMFESYVGQVGPIADRIPGSGPHLWIDGLVGRLGWLDYGLSAAWSKAFEVLWLALTALAFVGVVRAVLRRRAAALEFALWVVAIVPLLYVIANSGLGSRLAGNAGFEQARYLLPLAAIPVAGVGLALRQLPARVHGWAAAIVVTIALLHASGLWMVTVGRYFA